MEANTLAIGIKISNMVSVKRNGTMAVNTKVSIKMHQRKAKVNIAGPMAIGMLENGKTIC